MRRLALSIVPLLGLLPFALAGCKASYSPNTYASSAAQDEASVERGLIIGVRQVMITANDTVAIAAGGAAGGVAGAQVPGSPVATALGTIGGTLVGGIGGAAAAKAVGDTFGWEYIVQEDGNKLVSVTQTSKVPLPIGQHVLVIADAQQARIVPDYTVQIAQAAPAIPKPADAAKAGGANDTATPEMNIGPLLPQANAIEPLEVDPVAATPAMPAPVPVPAPAPAPVAGPRPALAGPATPGAAGSGNSAPVPVAPAAAPPANPPAAAPQAPSSTPPS